MAPALFLGALVAGCGAVAPAHRDARFVIHDLGGFTAADVARVRAELDASVRALAPYLGAPSAARLPVTVNLRPGPGVSHSHHGAGPIELHWVRERRAPIVHELTHVLAGYTPAHGHWTQEGFASYMQDRYGEDEAFPTRRLAHALVKAIVDDGALLPMLDVMRDRGRRRYFGLGDPWRRWLAYTQSTSLCTYLIEWHGAERFFRIYDLPFERMDFVGVYGMDAERLLEAWLREVTRGSPEDTRARAVYEEMRGTRGRR